MKKVFALLFFVNLAIIIYSQNAVINPNKEETLFTIQTLGVSVPISPEDDLLLYKNYSGMHYARYEVYDEYENCVYSEMITAKRSISDYFFTEQTVFYTEIPKFTWNGKNSDGEICPDGIYTVTIQFVNEQNEKLRNSENSLIIPDKVYYTIKIDTLSPDFNLDVQTVPRKNLDSDWEYDSLLIYSSGEMAASWSLSVYENDTLVETKDYAANSFGVSECFLPVFKWSAQKKYGTCEIVVIAKDLVGNESSRSCKINLSDEGSTVKVSELYTMQDFYVLTNAFKEKYNKKTLFSDETFDDSVFLQKSLYSSDIHSELVFRNGNDEFLFPVKNFKKQLAWQIPSNSLPVGMYQVSLKIKVLNEEKEINAGSLQITDRALQSKIKVDVFVSNKTSINEENMESLSAAAFSVKNISEETVGQEWKAVLYTQKHKYVATLNSGLFRTENEAFEFPWNGFDNSGKFVASSGEKYIFSLLLNGEIALEKQFRLGCICDDSNRIVIPDIIFPPNQTDFFSEEDLFSMNYDVIEAVATIIKTNKEKISKITIRGYANPTVYPIQSEMNKENEDSLIPLSLQRAVAVKNILILLGVPKEKLFVEGKGGLEWIAEPNNKNENYKNRRIQFFVE